MNLVLTILLSTITAAYSSQQKPISDFRSTSMTNHSSTKNQGPSHFDLTKEFNLDPKISVKTLKKSLSLYGCKTEDVAIQGTDPVTKSLRTVQVTLYKSIISRSKKAIVLLPPTGGVNVLDRGYANQICRAGISVALVEGWDHQLDTSLDYSMHDNGAIRYLAATQHVIEFLLDRNLTSIGLLGTSIGAVGGTLAFAVDDRIKAATLIVGSARLADIVAFSDEQGANQLRELRRTEFNLNSVTEYQKILNQSISIEPYKYLEGVNFQRKSLIITADEDTTVPSEYQYELVKLLNGKELRLKGNHLRAIKDTFWNHSSDIINFFKAHL